MLRRTTFGATKAQIDDFATLTPAKAVEQLFGAILPDPVLPIDTATGAEWVISGTNDSNSGDDELQEFFKGWMIGQMLSKGIDPNQSLSYSLREKIIFFYHTVLTTIQSKVNNSRSLYFQNQLFRVYAFDKLEGDPFNFKELTKKICVDNAMLRLLDGNLNVKGSPNENYARELHELYTIGRGLEGTLPPVTDPGDYFLFREQDVQAAAQVLSGWEIDDTFSTIDPDTNLPRGKVRGSVTDASGHDNGVKQFSDRFANLTIQPDPLLLNGANATEASALDEISQLIESLYASTETAKNICRRIYRFFVYHQVTPALSDSVITEMANTFQTNNFKIQPVLEELFKSEHFYEAAGGVDDDNFGGIIRSPLDLMLGTYRFFELTVPDPVTDAAGFYDRTNGMIRELSDMGMHFYEPFDVAGYDAYHQFPIYHRSWISTNYLTRRYEFIRNLVTDSQMTMEGPKIDVVAWVQANINNAIASDAKSLIIELASYLLPVSDNLTFDSAADDSSGLSAERLNYFLTAFLKSPQIDADPEGAWTFRWNNPVDTEVVRRQLENLFNAIMQSPEYQLY